MKINEILLNRLFDADFHTKMNSVKYSTNLRTIVTIGYMVKRHELENKKAVCDH